MSSTQFLTPIKMVMTSSMLPSFDVLHGFIYEFVKRILPQQPYLSGTIRNAISLALGYKSYSDLVDSARRNTAKPHYTEGNVFAFKEHEDAVWLSICHLAEKLWPYKKEVGVTELDDLHSILANDFFAFQVQDGHSMTYSLTLKNMEIIGAGYIGRLYETDDKTVFIRQLLQLYHRSQEWGYSPGLSFEFVSALSEGVVIDCDQDLLHETQLVNDDFLENKLNETCEDVRLTYVDTKFNQLMSKMDIPYDVLHYRAFSFKTHFAQPTSRGVLIPCTLKKSRKN